MQKNSIIRNKWFVLVVLSAATGLIYQLPYLRYSYYDSMLNTFGYSNAQLGNLMGVYGIGSLICYVLGGIAAERFPSKYLLSGGQILTGLSGFVFAMFPPYPIALFISFFWAFTTSLIYWPTLIDYVRNLGTDQEQGRLFGLLEGLRGILTTAIGLGIVAIFNQAATETLGLKNVIFAYAIINIVLGIVTFVLIPYEKKTAEADSEKGSILDNFRIALKKPEIWLVTIAIFCTMTCFICLGYLTPYLTGVMGATTVFAATIGTIRTWGLQIVGGTSGGVIADKIHSCSLTMAIAFLIIAIGFGAMAVLPSTQSFLIVATVLMFAFGFAIYINRGIYFATFTEAGVPSSINAIAVGFASAIGFLPDAFMYTVIGRILDTHAGASGYRIIFLIGTASGIVGLIMSALIFRNSKKNKH